MVFLWFSYGTIEEGKPIVYQRVSYSLPEGKLLINQLRQVEGNTQKLPDDLTNGRSQDRLLCVPRWHVTIKRWYLMAAKDESVNSKQNQILTHSVLSI
jgi:hypothetical protein